MGEGSEKEGCSNGEFRDGDKGRDGVGTRRCGGAKIKMDRTQKNLSISLSLFVCKGRERDWKGKEGKTSHRSS